MIQSPEDKIIVTVTSKYIKHFGSLTKRLSITDATSVHLEDFANIIGTVVSLPKGLSKKVVGNGIKPVKVVTRWYDNFVYQSRPLANRNGSDDPGGVGKQIRKEVLADPAAAAAWQEFKDRNK